MAHIKVKLIDGIPLFKDKKVNLPKNLLALLKSKGNNQSVTVDSKNISYDKNYKQGTAPGLHS